MHFWHSNNMVWETLLVRRLGLELRLDDPFLLELDSIISYFELRFNIAKKFCSNSLIAGWNPTFALGWTDAPNTCARTSIFLCRARFSNPRKLILSFLPLFWSCLLIGVVWYAKKKSWSQNFFVFWKVGIFALKCFDCGIVNTPQNDPAFRFSALITWKLYQTKPLLVEPDQN